MYLTARKGMTQTNLTSRRKEANGPAMFTTHQQEPMDLLIDSRKISKQKHHNEKKTTFRISVHEEIVKG